MIEVPYVRSVSSGNSAGFGRAGIAGHVVEYLRAIEAAVLLLRALVELRRDR